VFLPFVQRRMQESWPAIWLDRTRVRSLRLQRVAAEPFDGADGAPRRLFVDVSVISRRDAGTGIQRVVRSIAMALISDQPAGWEVVPVAATRKQQYRPIAWPNNPNAVQRSDLQAGLGDVFLSLDFSLDAIPRHRRQIIALQKQGVSCWFFMYDLLPLQNPEWFPDKLVVRFRRWLRVAATLADGFFCISPTVADTLCDQLAYRYGLPWSHMPATRVLPMGCEVQYASHSAGVSSDAERLLVQLRGQKTALMVGTLEPRKGHAEVLAAFELLWSTGVEMNLAIVGRPGWKTEDLQDTLRNHPLLRKRLFWFWNATDEEVERLYQACTGVVVASRAEGFGLPLIEALGYGKPVLARDIPVLHTVSSCRVDYFPADATAGLLAATIARWLAAANAATAPPDVASLPTWRGSARHMVRTLAEAG